MSLSIIFEKKHKSSMGLMSFIDFGTATLFSAMTNSFLYTEGKIGS